MPFSKIQSLGFGQSQSIHDHLIEFVLDKIERNLINGEVGVAFLDDAFVGHVAKERDFGEFFLRNRLFGATHNKIWLNANFTELPNAVLSRFGLQLARGLEIRHQS